MVRFDGGKEEKEENGLKCDEGEQIGTLSAATEIELELHHSN